MSIATDLTSETRTHALSFAAVEETLKSNVERGLSEQEVLIRRRLHGSNELATAPPVARWRRFVAQFQSLVIGILIVAALIAGALGEWIDMVAILAIVVLNGVLGFFQEDRAEQALAAAD